MEGGNIGKGRGVVGISKWGMYAGPLGSVHVALVVCNSEGGGDL